MSPKQTPQPHDYAANASTIYLYQSRDKGGWDILVCDEESYISDLVREDTLCMKSQIRGVNYRTLNDIFLVEAKNIPFVGRDSPKDYVIRYRIEKKQEEVRIKKIIKMLERRYKN